MPVRERYVSNGGVRIRYLDNGASSGPDLPVLFVPGITDFADEYQGALDLFAPRRLVIVELRGRGGSDAPPRGYSVADQAGDLEAVVTDGGLSRFHLMTFSRGTTPALDLALRQPGRVLTIAIGDYLAVEMALPEEFVETLWQSRWRGRPMPERVARHVLEGIQRDSHARELWADVAALGVPVMVVHGGDGTLVSDPLVERYRSTIAGVEVTMLAASGHDLFRPDRTAYPRAVLEFIGRRSPGT